MDCAMAGPRRMHTVNSRDRQARGNAMKLLSMIGIAAIFLTAPALAGTVVKGWIIDGSRASIRDCTRQGGTVVHSTSGQTHCYIYKH